MKRLKGFTLVELVIVIAIVIILSVVSVPIYRGYTRNAKMSEGYALLGAILSAEKAYYSQYGYFHRQGNEQSLNFPANYKAVYETFGIDARGNKYFTLFSPGTSSDVNYIFTTATLMSEDLAESFGGKNRLFLVYNVTSGSTIAHDMQKY